MAKKNVNVKVEENEFDEALVASKTFFDKHKNAILYGFGGVLTVIIAALLINQFYIVPRNNKANESIFAAEQLFMNGEYEKALNGDGDKLGFLAVADQFGSTKAGNLAHLYAAKCYAETEKYQEALDELNKFDQCGDELVSPATIGMKGNLYAELGQNEKAVELLVKAAKEADNNTLSPVFLIQAGQIYEELGNADKARECYMQIKTKYMQCMQYMEVDKYLERLAK